MKRPCNCRVLYLALLSLLVCFKSFGGVFLVQTGAVWKYLDDGSNQGTAWRATNFNDSAWSSGPAELGFGELDEATPIRGGYMTAYFRHYFVVENPQSITALTVGLKRDDGGIVFLNGSNVFRSNMPDDPVAYNTPALVAVEGTTFFTNPVSPQLLVPGTNLLAVEIHQSSPTSSDLSFDLWLRAETAGNVSSIALTTPANNSTVRWAQPFSIAASVSSTEAVLCVDFYAGTDFIVTICEPPYETAWEGTEPGPLVLRAVAFFDNGVIVTSAPVTVNIVTNFLPTVALGSPENGSFFRVGQTIYLSSYAYDSDGTIDSMVLRTNGVTLASYGGQPFNYAWQNASIGDYALTAIATDSDGASVTSSVVNIYVRENVLPTVSITSPQENQTVPGSFTITANAQDQDGYVAFVDFYVDGTNTGRASYSPYSVSVTDLSDGPHTLLASVVDDSGQTNFSGAVHVNVNRSLVLLLRGPYLQSCTQTSAIVRWRTDSAGSASVLFGLNNGVLTQVATSPATNTENEVLITGLSPNTRYFYGVAENGGMLASGSDYFFVTAPAQPKPTRIWAIGDFGTGTFSQIAVRDAYFNFTDTRYTDVWLMLGDNAYGGGRDDQYQSAVFDMYSSLLRHTCVWPTIGNHDLGYGPRGYVYTDIFSLPSNGEAGGMPSGTEYYYSYDYGDIHFVVLDSQFNSRASDGPMLSWLREDLDATLKRWTIAYWHHPPYTRGTHNSETEFQLIEMRQNALPILEAHNVDLVLTGHSHVYERSFLLNGHYGYMSSLNSSMVLDGGSGRTNETGAYRKSFEPNQGTVYAVVGCSGQIGGGSLDHPANFISIGGVGGSLVVDVDGNQLDGTFLTTSGNTMDTFTIVKSSDAPPLTIVREGGTTTLSWPVTFLSYVLESTPSLAPPVSWKTVTNEVFEVNSRVSVVVPTSTAHEYFRLRR